RSRHRRRRKRLRTTGTGRNRKYRRRPCLFLRSNKKPSSVQAKDAAHLQKHLGPPRARRHLLQRENLDRRKRRKLHPKRGERHSYRAQLTQERLLTKPFYPGIYSHPK